MGVRSRNTILVILSLAILSQSLFVAVNCQDETDETETVTETETETETATEAAAEIEEVVTTQAPDTETTTTATEAPPIPRELDYRFSSLVGGFTVRSHKTNF